MRIIEQSGQMIVCGADEAVDGGPRSTSGSARSSRFAVALTLGIVAARVLRFVLDEAVFPRMSLPRGVPAAISATVGYLVVTAGFVMAFSGGGARDEPVHLPRRRLRRRHRLRPPERRQQLRLRPDPSLSSVRSRSATSCRSATLQGRVRRIGIRSSTLATFDGAEVIVPNATLIATERGQLDAQRPRPAVSTSPSASATDPILARSLAILTRWRARTPRSWRRRGRRRCSSGSGTAALMFELRFWTPELRRLCPRG